MEKQFKRVGTHSGRFHADEVMSTAILKELFNFEIVRSRDPDILNELDLIYDIGEGEFDHHQHEKKYRENGTPYAACGLIWEKFGRDVILSTRSTLSEEDIEDLFYYMDRMLIEGIDASDNGLKIYTTIIPTMCISSIITEFNPPWDSCISEDSAFHDAVEFASIVLRNMLNQRLSVIMARSEVLKAYNNRIRPEILILERSYPWNRVLYQIDTEKDVLFVIYPRENEYLIQTVRKNDGTYGDRKRLPLTWAGKRGAELNKTIGIEDSIFCHSARFIAGAESLASILKMADLAIAEPPEPLPHIEAEGFMDTLKKFLLKNRVIIRY
jgi:uncharacterized UPF0160 family protein